MTSGKPGQAGGEAAGEFAGLFSAMMEAGLRQDFAAPATAAGKSSPLSGLAAEVLGPTVHIITTAEPATSDESLLAFARAQGMDEQALSMIFGQPAAPALPAAGLDDAAPAIPAITGLDGKSFAPASATLALQAGAGNAAAPAATPAAPAAPPAALPASGPLNNLLELGPEATLRWSVGEAAPAAAAQTALTPMFGLNGMRAALQPPAAGMAAADSSEEPAAHPESANQSLAASLILGATEAGQSARRMQLKQAGERWEKLAELAQPRLPLVAAAQASAATDVEVPVETLVLDIGMDESELQQLLQQQPADTRSGDSGQSRSGNGSAAEAARSDLDLRAEQYEKLSQRLGEALGQRLAAQIAKGDWKVEMALRPHDLGNIDIELAMKNGGLEASFTASEMRTRELISDGLPRLKEVLAQLGMDVASVNVNVRQNGQHGGNPTPGRQPGSSIAGTSGRASGGDSGMTAAPPARPAPVSDDGLDVLV